MCRWRLILVYIALTRLHQHGGNERVHVRGALQDSGAHRRVLWMRQVYLFGSIARGDNRPDSDFCVVTPDNYGLFGVGGFFADLRDTLGVEIDVV